MTLIMAGITRSYAILASDRRITSKVVDPSLPGGFRLTSQEDTDTKTILIDRRYVMGFAGLGRVQETDPDTGQVKRRRLESWLSEALAGVMTADYFDVLAQKFGPLCEQNNYLGPHTFLAVGYHTDGPKGATDPEVVRVSNSSRFRHQFEIHREPLGERAALFDTAGWSVSPELKARVDRALTKSAKRKPRRPDRLAEDLLHVMRETAAESNGHVGMETLITSFPRTAVPLASSMLWMDQPQPKNYREFEVSVFYPDPAKPEDPRRFYPAFICREYSIAGAQQEIGRLTGIGPLEGM